MALTPAGGEEVSEELRALVRTHGRDDLGPVVECRLGEDVEDAAGRPRLRVPGAEDDGRDAGEDDRPGAHRARLERDVEGGAGQPPTPERLGGRADRQDLGVGGGVAAQLALVSGPPQELVATEDRRPDRDVAGALGAARLLDRHPHPRMMGCCFGWLGVAGIHDRGVCPPATSEATGCCRRARLDAGVSAGKTTMKRLLRPLLPVLALSAAAATVPSAAAATAVAPARGFVPNQVVVKFDGQRQGRAVTVAPGSGVRQTAKALRRNPRVVYAQPNYVATASATDTASFDPNDPGTLGGASGTAATVGDWAFKQWNFLAPEEVEADGLPTSPGGIDAVSAWRHLTEAGNPGGAGVVVAVLDSGIAYRSLGSRFRRSPDFSPDQFVAGSDFVDADQIPLDENGHGTHVAG